MCSAAPHNLRHSLWYFTHLCCSFIFTFFLVRLRVYRHCFGKHWPICVQLKGALLSKRFLENLTFWKFRKLFWKLLQAFGGCGGGRWWWHFTLRHWLSRSAIRQTELSCKFEPGVRVKVLGFSLPNGKHNLALPN